GLSIEQSISRQARRPVQRTLYYKLNFHINWLLIRKALTLDLSYFEDARFYDKLQNARQESDTRTLQIVEQSFDAMRRMIILTAYLFIIVRFTPWVAAILLAAAILAFFVDKLYARRNFHLLSGQATERRKIEYIRELLTVDRYVKEIKLFQVGQTLLGRYLESFWKLFDEDIALTKKRSFINVGVGIVGFVTYYLCYIWIILSIISGAITFGDAIMFVLIFQRGEVTLRTLSSEVAQLYEHGLFISNVFAFLKLEPQMRPPRNPQSVPLSLQKGIEFRDVSFRYPGSSDWALRHINLTLRPNDNLALVGTNGAGKTTLIKLLTRLYDPTEGQIFVDGTDLRDYNLDEWQQKIGVIFQNFVRYQFTASENIGFGQVDALNDQARILEAARRGGADKVIADLPQAYDTVLGKWFEGGHELSGGQWQKIALSRAFMRDAAVLVLDEPTAALDAEQEYLIFQQFRQLTEDKLAILIYHRFSTVRLADCIAVMKDGQICELGSHEDLMREGGTYAHLFNIQAQGYR
ncbi:MAG: ABC transporter ATP-binding protein, partial [Chloroflexota bacterium]